MNHEDLIWDHFKFNADQRLKAFNFFLLLSIFANGGVITAIDKKMNPFLFVIIGVFLILLSILFWITDRRSKGLLWLSVDALLEIEQNFPAKSQIFRLDKDQRRPFIRYTTAISTLLVSQLVFGIGVTEFGFYGVWR